jgi:hypothetical protein
MIPLWILLGVATGGGDFEPDHSLYASGAILPLWAQISTRARGEGWGEEDLCFADLVMEFMAGVPLASLIGVSDHQIELQGWTIATIYDGRRNEEDHRTRLTGFAVTGRAGTASWQSTRGQHRWPT